MKAPSLRRQADQVASGIRKPLRVLLILKTSEGGLWILPHIDELQRRGHHVLVMLPAPPGRLRIALDLRGVTVVTSPFDFRYRPTLATVAGLMRLRSIFRWLAPDVLHYHLYSSALAARLASVGLGIPRVYMVAGPLYLESPPIRTAERLLARLDTVTIGGSDYTSRMYRELGRPTERTPAIPYGFDTQFFQPLGWSARTRARTALGVGTADFVVIMVALVYAPKRAVHAGRGIKGHDLLLTAWAEFHAGHPASHLVLVGSGFDKDGEAYRRELVGRFHLDDPAASTGVTWIGTTDDVRSYYSAADVSVSPSLSENHGAAVEAGAMGLPSIVSDAGALPETVEPRSGWVVPRGDPQALLAALERAHDEHLGGLLAQRGMCARRFVLRHFGGSNQAGRVADTLEEAAGRAPHGSAVPRVFSLFTEARFAAADGGWSPVDPENGAAAWERYSRSGDRLRLVGRVRQETKPERYLAANGIELSCLPYYVGVRGLLRNLLPLTRSVIRAVADAEVVLLRLPGAVGSIAAVVCRLLRRRYAVEVVGDPFDVLRSGALGLSGRFLARPAGACLRWVVRGATASKFVTRKALQLRYPPRPGTPALAMSNVRLGPGTLVGTARTWRPGPFEIVAIGSQETHYKGHDVLLRALRRLLDDGVDVTATVLGDGRLHAELVALCRSEKLAAHVRFRGTISDRAEILTLLDAAALFVMPSRTEGLPRALVEAMGRAVPAIGSAVGGIPELLDKSCLVPAGDHLALAAAMGRVLGDRVAWEEQSRRNLEMARTYEQSLLDTKLTTWLSQVPSARPGYGRRIPADHQRPDEDRGMKP